MSYETVTYPDATEALQHRVEKIIYGYESPSATLGDIALKFIIGHGIAAELAHAPMDTYTLTPEPADYARTLEAIVDTTYLADPGRPSRSTSR